MAPIQQGQQVGKIVYYLDGNEVGECPLVAATHVDKAKIKDMIPYMCGRFFKLCK